MNKLEVVRAGAGSGKTYNLCECVARAIDGGLDPARILATTFTRKAAAELKGRMQSKLLARGGRSADRLELASIGTVHSVAHQLVRRYAIEIGQSPRLDVLSEAVSERFLRELPELTASEGRAASEALNERLAIPDLHGLMLELLSLKRLNRISETSLVANLAASAHRVCELLHADATDLFDDDPSRLDELLAAALQGIESLTEDNYANTQKARATLRSLIGSGAHTWKSYLTAAKITASKRTGADAMLDELRTHVALVRRNRSLHAEVIEFSQRLADETIRLEHHDGEYKTNRGLVDFTDLETLFLSCLTTSVWPNVCDGISI